MKGRESWHDDQAMAASRLCSFSITASDRLPRFHNAADKRTEQKRECEGRGERKRREKEEEVKDQEATRLSCCLGARDRATSFTSLSLENKK